MDANFAADDVSGEKSLARPVEVNVVSHDLCYWLSIGELQSKEMNACHKSNCFSKPIKRIKSFVNHENAHVAEHPTSQ